tara:strand:- start:351 stop:1274 length:924 start_codon:yes stop_codon:yes gene_type:complete
MTNISFDPFEFKPDISASSRKLYTFNLTKLNNGKDIKNLNYLAKPEILEKLSSLKSNTKRTYIIAIVSSLKDRPETKYKKSYLKFYEMLVSINKELKTNNTKSEKQEDNWLSQNAVKEKCDSLMEIVPKISKKRKLSEGEYKQLLDAVILGLYCLQPPRRNKDYTDMLIVKSVPSDKEYNYLDTKGMKWIFNNFKTQKTYKQQVMDIPPELKKLLKVYLKFHPKSKDIKSGECRVSFLMTYDGKAIDNSTEMTRALNRIFGKKVGSSLLRNIYLTNKYGDKAKELKEDALEMGTSVDTASNHYIKHD